MTRLPNSNSQCWSQIPQREILKFGSVSLILPPVSGMREPGTDLISVQTNLGSQTFKMGKC
jgi:hypothetical protein